MTELLDYSQGYPGGAAIKAAGQDGVVRYLWGWQTSGSGGKGIDAAEYRDLKAHGLAVAVVYESTADRSLGGVLAGIADANYAQAQLAAVGLPAQLPIYAVIDDWGADASDFAAIGQYLAGWATIVGRKRLGAYGGIVPIAHFLGTGEITFAWQTLAWSAGQVAQGISIYQYDTAYADRNIIGGVACDRNRTSLADWGQDTAVGSTDVAQFPKPDLPSWYEAADARPNPSQADWQGDRWIPQRLNVTALKTTYQYAKPDTKSAHTRAPINPGEKIACRWAFEGDDKRLWGANADGYFVLSGFSPVVTLPHARAPKPAAAKAG